MGKFDVTALRGHSLMFWAKEWFRLSNDAFYNLYGFNFNPHEYPGLYQEARERVYGKDGRWQVNHDATHCADYKKERMPQDLLQGAVDRRTAEHPLSVADLMEQFQRDKDVSEMAEKGR